MSRPRHRIIGGPTVRIGEVVYSQALAKIIFRCEVCYGDLIEHNAGLACASNPVHRGYIHRDEVARILAAQAATANELSQFYTIVDGKVVPK